MSVCQDQIVKSESRGVSRSCEDVKCQEGVKRVSAVEFQEVSRGWQERANRVSRGVSGGCQEGVKRVSRRNIEGVKRASRQSQQDFKRDVKKVSGLHSQEGVKRVLRASKSVTETDQEGVERVS